MRIINLTQHSATAEQRDAGVIDMPAEQRAELQQLLTFDSIPSTLDLTERAVRIALLAQSEDAEAVMIGGAPYLMSHLEGALQRMEIQPLYAFSRRESVEETQADGSVIKRAIFKHLGFVEAV